MKTWPPLPHPADAPQLRRRIPAFHPVPVGARKDGWTPTRQAAFVGLLAETRSVEGACRRLGMGKESAYRLRKRRGAAGFAAAWDAALGKPRPWTCRARSPRGSTPNTATAWACCRS